MLMDGDTNRVRGDSMREICHLSFIIIGVFSLLFMFIVHIGSARASKQTSSETEKQKMKRPRPVLERHSPP